MNRSLSSKLYKVTEYAVLIIYTVFLTEAFLRASAFDFIWSDRLHNILRAVILIVIAVRYITGWISFGLRDIPKVVILVAIALMLASSRFFNDVGSFIDVGLLILAAKDIDLKKILKLFMIVTAILLMLSVIASLSANVENYLSYHGTSVRYGFGTLSALDFASYFFYLELAWFAIRREKIRYFEFAIIVAVIIALLLLCGARTSGAAMAAALIVAFIFKLRSWSLAKKNKSGNLLPSWLLYVGALLVILCAAFIIIATYRYNENSSLSLLLDKVLNNRLSLGKIGMDRYGFSLFGKMVETTGVPGTADYFFIDSSFVFILLRYGIVTFIGAIALFQIPALYAAGKKDAWTVMIIAFISLHCIMEHHLLAVNFNPFIFTAAMAGGALARKAEGSRTQIEVAPDNTSVKKRLPAIICLTAIALVFAASTIYFIVTAGKNPQYGIYETTVSAKGKAEEFPLDGSIEQEVLTPKDICGIDIMFDTEGPIKGSYIWTMWEDEFGHSTSVEIPAQQIKDEEYTRIVTDSKELLSWLKYRFTIKPADGASGDIAVMTAEKANDFGRAVYKNGQKTNGPVMNYNLVFCYNDWRMMVWIFELTALSAVFYFFASGRIKKRI